MHTYAQVLSNEVRRLIAAACGYTRLCACPFSMSDARVYTVVHGARHSPTSCSASVPHHSSMPMTCHASSMRLSKRGTMPQGDTITKDIICNLRYFYELRYYS